jgi:hypothetical protein
MMASSGVDGVGKSGGEQATLDCPKAELSYGIAAGGH